MTTNNDTVTTTDPAVAPRRLRLRRANRQDVVPVPARLENLIPANHLARRMWNVVKGLDLTAFYARIQVVADGPGAAAIDPLILITLWLYATSQGVTSARRLDNLRLDHRAYIWICGGVALNYHTISDFRVDHESELDELMTQVLAQLAQAEVVDLTTQAQDGMRVRASAGAASFRREPTLEKALTQAQEQQAQVIHRTTTAPDTRPARQKAAQERAARERVARVAAALTAMPAARATKKAADRDQARVSSTDYEARVMKMPDGGYRPAYNWQFSVELSHFAITGVDVVTTGSDRSQMEPMVDQVLARTQRLPRNWLGDGGFVKLQAIENLTAKGVTTFCPVPEAKDKTRDRYAPLPSDTVAVVAWRQRMGTAAGKAMYKKRSLVELPNAQARNRYGVQQVRVRGRRKVRCVALWVALTHNLLIWIKHLRQTVTLAPVQSVPMTA
jgi:transposase